MARAILDPAVEQQHEDKPVGSWAASCNGSIASVPPALDLPFPSLEFSEAETAYTSNLDVPGQLTAMTGQAEQTISHLGLIFGVGGKRKLAELAARAAAQKAAKTAYKAGGSEAATKAYKAQMASRRPSDAVAMEGWLEKEGVEATIRNGNMDRVRSTARWLDWRKQEIAEKGIEQVRHEDDVWRSLHVYDGLLK